MSYKVTRVKSQRGLKAFQEIENLIEKTETTFITVNEALQSPKEIGSNLSLVTYEHGDQS